MDEARRVDAAERQIAHFDVYETDRGWLAVHQRDHDLRLEHTDWRDLFWLCVTARMVTEFREAAEELAARMAEPGRQ
ncbi:hypothetical protein E1287_14180 [Actinomadura sp. KC06]|uniref:hypothetical protein n=1 Tax=Actinomadura sp. KC06 TaxID=2530369 RepID=UPI001050212B|nr:hypothetical protein [Actinomadura sp. KC06]TDD35256.1 hypothetical protein E1287_14180 [Actinomadura sp. KC06]